MISKKNSVKKVGVLGWLLFLYSQRAGCAFIWGGYGDSFTFFFFFFFFFEMKLMALNQKEGNYIIRIIIEYFHIAFGTKKSTLLIASKFLDIQIAMNHILRNVTIPIFGFIRNLLRFLGM